MAERRKLAAVKPPAAKGRTRNDDKFVSSGSFLLDLALGGGWGRGRVSNIVGDKSSGKTLLAVEACANVSMRGGLERSRYGEAESAFDDEYAKLIGMPDGMGRPDAPLATVQEFESDLAAFLKERKGDRGSPGIYVLDSLDALSDNAEMAREMGEGSYGTGKAKAMSELFRRHIDGITQADIHLLIISQIRDKIGVTFGETKTRSGGRALDFYASQIVWLAETGKLKRTTRGIDRVVGAKVLAKVKKNKLGMPFREVEMHVLFRYGVDDQTSMLEWVKKHKAEDVLPEPVAALTKQLAAARASGDRAALRQIDDALREGVGAVWDEVEESLQPPMSKYGD